MLRGNGEAVNLESRYISFDGFTDVGDGLVFRFSLTDAAREAGALDDLIAVFAGIEDNLSHDL